jgi:hypothetical protein
MTAFSETIDHFNQTRALLLLLLLLLVMAPHLGGVSA